MASNLSSLPDFRSNLRAGKSTPFAQDVPAEQWLGSTTPNSTGRAPMSIASPGLLLPQQVPESPGPQDLVKYTQSPRTPEPLSKINLPTISTYRQNPLKASSSGTPESVAKQHALRLLQPTAAGNCVQGVGATQPSSPGAPTYSSPCLSPAPNQQQSPGIDYTPALAVDQAGATRLRLHIITYNMAGTLPASLPDSLFKQEGTAADMYVVGSQESCSLTDWERLVCKGLGTAYVKVAQESLMAISILVFAHKNVADHVTDIHTSSVACGIGNVLGNKGGVAVSCSFAGVRLLLVTSHLAAHDEFIERRNADYQRIYAGLFGTASTTGNLPVAAAPRRSGCTTPQAVGSPRDTSANSTPAATPAHSMPPPGSPAHMRLSRLASSSSMAQMPHQSGIPRTASLGALTAALSPGSPAVHGTPTSQVYSPLGSLVGPGSHALSSTGTTEAQMPSQRLDDLLANARGSVVPLHDVVVWSGDLNYRINGTSSLIMKVLQTNMLEVLHANDQLRLEMHKGKAFHGFHEQAIHFKPSFKYLPGTSTYSGKRVPSWTDRILHTAHAHEHACCLDPLYYRDVPELMDSDHRPVVAGYDLTISPHVKPGPHTSPSNRCRVC